MKKALIFSNQGISVPTLAMELEVIDELRSSGYEVHVLTCNGCLETCYFNPVHNLLGCAICESRSVHFHTRTAIPKTNRHKLHEFREVAQLSFPFFEDMHSLRTYMYEGINIGRGVVSSIVSLTRSNYVSSHTHPELVEQQLRVSLQALFNARLYIEMLQPSRVMVYNGRFAEVFPFVELCEQLGIEYQTMEMEVNFTHYNTYPNGLPHSIRIFQQQLEEVWKAADPQQREAEAIAWFQQCRSGHKLYNSTFLEKMVKGVLPEGFDEKRCNVAILNSSDDEFVALSEWAPDLYENQNEAIEKILRQFENQPDFHFYLRVHPNLRGIDNPQTRGIAALTFDNLTIIPADASIDTYSLMDACDKVIVFGSTTGIEATFWGNTSILLAPASYQYLNCVYKPANWDEAFSLIANRSLPPIDRAATLPYAYFIQHRGRPYKRFRWGGKESSDFDGQRVRKVYPSTLLYLLRYLGKLPLWFRSFRILNNRTMGLADMLKLKSQHILPKSIDYH